MALDKTTLQENAGATIQDDDTFRAVQGGATVKFVFAQVKAWIRGWITKSDVGLGNVVNADTTNASNISAGTLDPAHLPAFGGGDVSFVAAGGNGTIGGNAVSNAKAAQMPAYTLKGNATGGTANASDLSIPALTLKASPVSADLVLIADSAASNAFKQTTVGAIAATAVQVQCELFINKGVNIDQTWAGAVAFASGSNNPHPGASRATETYGPDGWRLGADSGTGDFTGRRLNSPGTVPGIDNFLQLVVTTADASVTAANNYHVEIPVEGPRSAPLMFGTSSAKPVTVQFWWAGVNGTYALSAVEGTNSRSCTKTFIYSGGGAGQQFILTFPADTGGTWSRNPGAIGLKFIFDMGCGSTYETASTGVWQAGLFIRTSACTRAIATLSTNYITGFQADVGSFALPPPFRFVDPAKDLLDCQRYYFKSFSQATQVAQNAGFTDAITYIAEVAGVTAGGGAQLRFPVSGMTSPVITTFNPGAANTKWRNQSASADSGTPTVFNKGTEGLFLYNPQVVGDGAASLQTLHLVANMRMGGF